MRYELRSKDSRVLYLSSPVLGRSEVRLFTTNAFTRRQRRRLKALGVDLMGDLERDGELKYSLQPAHTKKKLLGKDPMVVVRAKILPKYRDGHALFCQGDLAAEVVGRVNAVLKPKVWKRRERREQMLQFAAKKKRDLEKRRKREAARKERQKQAPRKKLKGIKKRPFAPISQKRFEPIYQSAGRVRWHELVRATGMIFKVDHQLLLSTQQIVEFDLLSKLGKSMERSLKRNGRSFTYFRRDGFTLRFDMLDDDFDEHESRFTVSVTRDSKHPLYYRTLAYFSLLFSEPIQKRGGKRAVRNALREFMPTLLLAA